MNLFVNTEKQLIHVCCAILYCSLSSLKLFFHINSVINEPCLLSKAFGYIRYLLCLHNNLYIFRERTRVHKHLATFNAGLFWLLFGLMQLSPAMASLFTLVSLQFPICVVQVYRIPFLLLPFFSISLINKSRALVCLIWVQ